MAILVDRHSHVMVQGITGGAGKFHTERMLAYGTNIVGGVTPGKGGQSVFEKPVFDTVAECIEKTGADVSVIFLPAAAVKEAAIEAIRAGIKFLVVIPEHIPIHDMLHVRREAVAHGATVIGGNTAGVITPGEANLGIMPDIAFSPGRVGTVSRSGSITYYVADTLTRSGYGESTCVGLGGDPVLGSTFDEILWKFEQDDKTKAVVMTGEIGGVYEERATETISRMKTPVLAMVGGIFAPPGKRMGHAGAIVEGRMGTAKEKLDMLAAAGAHACRTFTDIPETLKKLGV
ncbi:MAG: succinate--CoA ligase subunit alpha [candidate division Zixibacteria bacterium]|nr:succinate--CoA ligase subunit alpha [candidate division Zixibacteria bacterium]